MKPIEEYATQVKQKYNTEQDIFDVEDCIEFVVNQAFFNDEISAAACDALAKKIKCLL